MSDYRETEAEFPDLAELTTFSAAWYARWRDLHLAKYPDVDQVTRDNLNQFVRDAEKREHPLGQREVSYCVYVGCPWEHSAPYPPSLDTLKATEQTIKAHLDDAHVGWTIEEVTRLSQLRRVPEVFGVGAKEMLG